MNVVLLTALGIVFPAQAQLTGAQDTGSIEQQMGRMIDLLDSHVYEQTVSWDEHVVLCYGLAHGREPAPEELVSEPEAGVHLHPGRGFQFSETPLHIRNPAPALGQHNDFLYRDLMGLGDDEVQRLTEERHIGDRYVVAGAPV